MAESLVTLAGALIHQAGGRGAEVADFLHRALSAEAPDGVSRTAAAAFRELGYLSVQRGVPDRALDGVAAEHWTAFEPFVAGVRGETDLAAGRLDAAADLIDRGDSVAH